MKYLKLAAIAATLCILLWSKNTYAQPPTTVLPGAPDINLGTVVTDPDEVNCDMLDIGASLPGASGFNGTDKLWVIAYAGEYNIPAGPNGVVVGMESAGAGSYAKMTLPVAPPVGYDGIFNPDVVLGNWYDVGTSTWHYYSAVVYCARENTSPFDFHIFMDVYEILPNSGTMSISATPVFAQTQLSTGSLNLFPHIDLCADGRGFPFGPYTPDMHMFAATWKSGTTDISGVYGDISGTPVISAIKSITTTGIDNDVACTYDPVAGTSTAYVSYVSGTDMYVVDWNLVTGTPGTPVLVYTGSNVITLPRIDAATVYDYSNTNAGALWNIVVELQRSITICPGACIFAAEQAIFHITKGRYTLVLPNPQTFNYFDEYNTLPNMESPTKFWTNRKPAICGTGDFIGGGESPGNYQFTTVFGTSTVTSTPPPPPQYGAYCAYPVENRYPHNGSSVFPNPGNISYYINTNPLAKPITAMHFGLGVATCTNTGYDVLVAWTDDDAAGNVMYKFGTGTTYAFKTSGVNTIAKLTDYTVWPSPATDIVYVKTTENAGYVMTDMLGKIIQVGSLAIGDNSINVHALASGTYTLSFTNDYNIQKTKFVKQ